LISKGIPPTRLEAAGRGEFKPLFNNDTPEQRALNSRAEIVIIYPLKSEVIDLGVAQRFEVSPDIDPQLELPPIGSPGDTTNEVTQP